MKKARDDEIKFILYTIPVLLFIQHGLYSFNWFHIGYDSHPNNYLTVVDSFHIVCKRVGKQQASIM